MKKPFLFFLFTFFLIRFSAAQILCVQCFEQNDSVWAGSNNLILNGGFENTTCLPFDSSFCVLSDRYNCDISNWTCTGGGNQSYPEITDSVFGYVPQGNLAPYFGNYYCLPCSNVFNDYSCFNFSGCTISGIPNTNPFSQYPGYGDTTGISLSQTVTGLTPGSIYILEFWAGGESANEFCFMNGMFALDIGFGNTFLTCKPTPPDTGTGTRFLIPFNAVSSSHTIKFTNWGHICVGCTELILDDVKLYLWNATTDPPLPCGNTIGINEPYKNNVIISPNPATNELTVNTNNNQPSTIIIYDLLSNKLIEKTFINTITLNTEFLSKGIYMYEVRTDKGSEKGKLIKE